MLEIIQDRAVVIMECEQETYQTFEWFESLAGFPVECYYFRWPSVTSNPDFKVTIFSTSNKSPVVQGTTILTIRNKNWTELEPTFWTEPNRTRTLTKPNPWMWRTRTEPEPCSCSLGSCQVRQIYTKFAK